MSDVLSILGKSKCEVLSCLGLKGTTMAYALLRKVRNILVYSLIMGVHLQE